jgi:hypothetical protein
VAVFGATSKERRIDGQIGAGEENMKNKKRVALALPDLRNGQRGSVWFSKDDRNVPGNLSAPLLWQSIELSSDGRLVSDGHAN